MPSRTDADDTPTGDANHRHELAAVARVFCGQSDPDAQFQLGLDLMLRGLDS